MRTDSLLSSLDASGVELWLEGDRLRFRAPAGALTTELREALTANKAEIVARLQTVSASAETAQPLSFNQQALYFLHRSSPRSSAYNIGVALRIRSIVSTEALDHALQALVDRHATLRARFEDGPAEPVQISAGRVDVSVARIDARGLTEDELGSTVERAHREPFDLAAGGLFRPTLLSRSETDHVLLLTMHHIAADGWSIWVMLDELRTLYRAHVSGTPAALPRPGTSYADFVRGQREMLAGPRGAALRTYWRTRLEDDPAPLDLPWDAAPAKHRPDAGATHVFDLSPALSTGLKTLAREQGTTLFTVLMAAYQAVLSRYSGRTDILVATPASGRGRTELHGTVGDFMNSVVIRGDLSGDPTFVELLDRLKRSVVDAVAHEDYPFACLVQELGITRDADRPPVFQTMLTLQKPQRSADLTGLFSPTQLGAPVDFGGLAVEPFFFVQQEGQLELSLELIDIGSSIVGSVKYRRALFGAATIARLTTHLETLLHGAVMHPEQRLSELPMLTPGERAEIVTAWNETATPYPSAAGLEELFEAQARRTPGRVAIRQAGGDVTYGDLNTRANRIARRLRQLGVGPDVLVAVGLPRTPDLIATLLGVAKAGGAYVPLDPGFPAQRLQWMLEDARPAVLVTERALAGSWPAGDAHVLCLDDPIERIDREDEADLPPVATPESLAYVIFTSGSTGRPKGVQIPRRAVVNFLTSMQRTPGLTATDRLLAVTTLSFDIAVLELFLPLVTGAAVVLATREDATDAHRLMSLLSSEAVTVMQATPATWRMLIEVGWRGDRRIRVLCGGEALAPDLSDALLARSGELWNLYGPTETTVWSTVARVTAGAPITIGRPVANTQVYVLGAALEVLPAGVPGELWIGGDGVARGYHERPDLTADRFVANPFMSGERMYRTGDLARWRADGLLEHLGRLDDQVKIRGFRIELGEIEQALLSHPSVREAAALAQGAGGDVRLVAFIVPSDGSVDGSDVRLHSRERLPDYMVPSVVLPIDALPRTANGKRDRRALARIAQEMLRHAPASRVAPRTETELAVAAIWQELLRVAEPGAGDNFFDLGGHSLLATQLVTRVRARLGIELAMRTVFETPTLEAFAAHIDTLRGSDGYREVAADHEIARVSRDEPLPLSFSQERLWFLAQLDPTNTAYSIPLTLRLSGSLNADALEGSCRDLIERHEALRTCFSQDLDRPVQVILPVWDRVLERVAIAPRSGGDPWSEAIRLVTAEARRPFDLACGPLVRMVLYRLSDVDHVLLVNLHHIVSDQWSIGILVRELSTCYRARLGGAVAALPALPIQYADFAAWQRETSNMEALREQRDYWMNRLAGLEPLILPVEPPDAPDAAAPSAILSYALPPALLERLKATSVAVGVTLSMALLAGFLIVLRRYTGRDDLAVGAPVANRRMPAVEDVVGVFINMLVLRADVSGNPSVRHLIERVRNVTLEAYERQDVPFEQLVAALHPAREQRRSPLVQVMFNVLNTPAETVDLDGVTCTPVILQRAEPQVELSWAIEPEVTGSVYVEFDTSIYRRSTIERMLRHYERALEALVADLAVPIDAVDLLTTEERRPLLAEVNATTADYPADLGVEALFEQQAIAAPDRIAVMDESGAITYGDLNARANTIAHRLRALGVGPDVLVAVGLTRTPALVATLLGILKAGGAYVPLDPAFPAERLRSMLEDARPAVLVTELTLVESWPTHTARVLCLDEPDDVSGAPGPLPPATTAGPESLAYVIFTSGSTGRPKGVQITRRALVNFIVSMQKEPGFNPDDRLLAVTTLSFDIAGLELFLPLASGGSVVLASRGDATDGWRLLRMLETSGATMMQATPATWRMLIDAGWSGSAGLRVLVGGEPLPADLADALLARSPEVWNLYGPTETTIWSTAARVRRGERISVGRPIANTQVYILGPGRELLPAGVAGELWIGGDGLARGYLGRPDLTEERFVPNPFVAGARIYRTGDVARWGSDGQLEHLGRADDQVKIRGFRIELGEIEHALSTHPSVRQAAAISYGGPADARLVAFVVPSGESIDSAELRQHVRDRLPDYMVPSAFLPLTALPLTSNGKVDRRTLAERATAGLQKQPAPGPAGVRTITPMEDMLAAIWADVLDLPRVEPAQDFFEMGGHSLLAARLVAQMSEIFRVKLPVSMMFEAPTVAQMAQVLILRMAEQRQKEPPAANGVIALNTTGARPPFLFLHAALQGDGFYCYNLARHLGEDQPMFALPPLGLDGTTTPPTIEAMAAARLDDIRRLQPAGPYYLGGFCLSGLVALEVARQLKAAGEQVAFLVVIESRMHPPHVFNRASNSLAAVAAALGRFSIDQRLELVLRLRPLAHTASDLWKAGGWDAVRRIARGLSSLVAGRLRGSRDEPPSLKTPTAHLGDALRDNVNAVNRLASHAYLARPYDGPITCMWAEEEEFRTDIWQMVTPGVHLQPVPGNHNTCITTQVDSLGRHLRDALHRAQAGPGTPEASAVAYNPASTRRDRVTQAG